MVIDNPANPDHNICQNIQMRHVKAFKKACVQSHATLGSIQTTVTAQRDGINSDQAAEERASVNSDFTSVINSISTSKENISNSNKQNTKEPWGLLQILPDYMRRLVKKNIDFKNVNHNVKFKVIDMHKFFESKDV